MLNYSVAELRVISLHNVLLRLDRENNRAGACLFGLHLVE